MHKEQKNLEYTKLKLGHKYKVTTNVEESPFEELDFINNNDSRIIHFNIKVLSEHPKFFLCKALPDDYIVNSVNVTVSKAHLLTRVVKLKELK